MRYQIDGQRLRLRLGHAEFSALLQGKTLQASTSFAGLFSLEVALYATDQSEAHLAGSAACWQIGLPRAALHELSGRLPCRDGLSLRLDTSTGHSEQALELCVDVDVRDRRPG